MKYTPLILLPFLLTSCPAPKPATQEPVSSYRPWKVGEYRPNVDHAPKLVGYRQVQTTGVAFRDYIIDHPKGLWTASLDEKEPLPPILITTFSGSAKRFDGEWYPEEGGADSATVYAFVKGDETLVILQGTSSVVSEETRIKYRGGTVIDTRRFAEKGTGMGPDMPGEEPKYREYPPRN